MIEHAASSGQPRVSDTSEVYLVDYARRLAAGNAHEARNALLDALAGKAESDWLNCARRLVLRADIETASAVLLRALDAFPQSTELRRALAGLYGQTGRTAEAEHLLRSILGQRPGDVAATFLLARMLKDAGRAAACATTMRALFEHARQDVELVIQAVEMLDACGRKSDAAAICQGEIASGSRDPRIYAYAAMLEIQTGEFERAREHYGFALANSPHALEWFVPHGLASAQRYEHGDHPDFALFRDLLQRSNMSDKARSSLLFALGKAHDDIGDYAQAVQYFRQANAIRRALVPWSRKQWRRSIEARIAARPREHRLEPSRDWTPIFVVGVPRSGTTLVAELLSRNRWVCNRGELGWLSALARQLADGVREDPTSLRAVAHRYAAQLRQDDSDARWFIDKQPLNLLHADLILALWPNARIIHCTRNARDTALSLWMQDFSEPEHGYACDFTDIAAVIHGCDRLMAHWKRTHAASICTVRYEHLASNPEECLAELASWLGLPDGAASTSSVDAESSISTASLWQARQPVYTRSIGRSRPYEALLPELRQFSDQWQDIPRRHSSGCVE